MPVPHLAGSWQVITPPTSDQPWLDSRDFALAMLNGYGPTPPLSFWIGGAYGSGRVVGAVRAPDPEGERRGGPVPVQHRQGEVPAVQPRLVRGRRRDDLPGPGQVRHRHQEGPAAEVHLRLLDRRGRVHRDVAGH